ncbi:uncharacterized protein LOC141614023 [Silene latifolia]|uniref:uncharacterized protein LOC141614023 n=1 Tax=Silene latifolia TaxID=37657 RepID=UPI003D787379
MIISSWNVRGVNDPLKQQEVLDFLLRHKLDCGALIETHIKADKMSSVYRKIFAKFSLISNYEFHYGGRIWILWNPVHIHVELLKKGHNSSFALYFILPLENKLEIPFVYAFNRASKRVGCAVHDKDMQEFRDCILSCSLADHPFTGGQFTWHNKQDLTPRWAKLDRLLVNPEWYMQLPTSTVAFLPAGMSDHASILLSITSPIGKQQSFRYLNCWAISPDFHHTGIHHVEFSGITNRVAEAKAKLTDYQLLLQSTPLNTLLLAQEKATLNAYAKLKKAEMRVLAQRAKIQHLQLSDANTRCFYASIVARKSRNTIGVIEDAHGVICKGHTKVSQAFQNFYKNLLGTAENNVKLPSKLFTQHTLTHGSHLENPITSKEIEEALFSIDRNKSPRVDGYTSGFFRDTWAIRSGFSMRCLCKNF